MSKNETKAQKIEIAFKAMLEREYPAHSRLSKRLDGCACGEDRITIDGNFATEIEGEIFKALKDLVTQL